MPCGSGIKAKRCCGVDAARVRARLAAEAAGDLLALATHFPRYRPVGAAFDAWAEHAPKEPTSEAVKAGLATLDAAERRRVVEGFVRDHPELWQPEMGDDAALALALALDPGDLWSVVETAIAGEELAGVPDDDVRLEAAAGFRKSWWIGAWPRSSSTCDSRATLVSRPVAAMI